MAKYEVPKTDQPPIPHPVSTPPSIGTETVEGEHHTEKFEYTPTCK